ncbi:hypothetical protein MRX96_006470 [Rhipicephalus microplus]
MYPGGTTRKRGKEGLQPRATAKSSQAARNLACRSAARRGQHAPRPFRSTGRQVLEHANCCRHLPRLVQAALAHQRVAQCERVPFPKHMGVTLQGACKGSRY